MRQTILCVVRGVVLGAIVGSGAGLAWGQQLLAQSGVAENVKTTYAYPAPTQPAQQENPNKLTAAPLRGTSTAGQPEASSTVAQPVQGGTPGTVIYYDTPQGLQMQPAPAPKSSTPSWWPFKKRTQTPANTVSQPRYPGTPGATGTVAKMPANPNSQLQARLKQKVRATLGNTVQDVDLQFDGMGGCKVVSKVRSDADMQKVVEGIMRVPELADYKVSMEFQMDMPMPVVNQPK